VERGSGVPNLVTWGMQSHKECHNCIFKSRIHVSDTSAHIDYYTAWLTKVKMSTKSFESAENRLQDKLSLMHELIAPPIYICDKNVAQNTRPFR